MRRALICFVTLVVLMGACSKQELPEASSKSIKAKPVQSRKAKKVEPKEDFTALGALQGTSFTKARIQGPAGWNVLGDNKIRIFDNKEEQIFLVLWGVKAGPETTPKNFLKQNALQYLRSPRFYKRGERILVEGKSRLLVHVYREWKQGPYEVVYAEGSGLDRILREHRTFSVATIRDREGHSMVLLGLGPDDAYLKLKELFRTMLQTLL